MLVPRNNGVCAKAPINKAVDEPYGVMVKEIPYVIFSTGELLDAEHVLNGWVGTLHFPID